MLDFPKFCSREKVDAGLQSAVDKHEELSPEEPSGPSLGPHEQGVVSVGCLRWRLISLDPISDQGQPADDGGHQDEDHHLGDVVDVGLMLAVPDPDLSVESLDVAEEARVEGDDDSEGEEEHEGDEREHVDPETGPIGIVSRVRIQV